MRSGLAIGFALAGLIATAFGEAEAGGRDALIAFAREKAAVIDLLQTRAARAVATAANDHFILDFVVASRDDVRAILKEKIDRQLVGIQKGLHVEEICLIAHDGREYARIVRGEIATDLEPDESDASFFAPTWKVAGNEPYVSPVYRSGDTDEWVIAYSMPAGGAGEQDALLHLEQNVSRLLALVATRPAPQEIRWYVVEDGTRILFDSAASGLALAGPATARDPAEAFAPSPIEAEMLDVILASTAFGAISRVTIDGRAFDVAASHHGRWTVLALRDAAV